MKEEQNFNRQSELSVNRRNQRNLTNIYGHNIFQNCKTLANRRQTRERTYSFLQDNLDEIDDHLLKMMPLLRNVTKENVIPLIDFEDQTQVDLNYLLMHCYDCLPNIGLKFSDIAVVRLPSDQNLEIAFLDSF